MQAYDSETEFASDDNMEVLRSRIRITSVINPLIPDRRF